MSDIQDVNKSDTCGNLNGHSDLSLLCRLCDEKNNGRSQEGFEHSLLETKDWSHDGSTICSSFVASLDRAIHPFYLLGIKSKIQSGKQSRSRHCAGKCNVKSRCVYVTMAYYTSVH